MPVWGRNSRICPFEFRSGSIVAMRPKIDPRMSRVMKTLSPPNIVFTRSGFKVSQSFYTDLHIAFCRPLTNRAEIEVTNVVGERCGAIKRCQGTILPRLCGLVIRDMYLTRYPTRVARRTYSLSLFLRIVRPRAYIQKAAFGSYLCQGRALLSHSPVRSANRSVPGSARC